MKLILKFLIFVTTATVKGQVTASDAEACDWEKVRHLPEGCTKWYESTDELRGTDVFGDPADDL